MDAVEKYRLNRIKRLEQKYGKYHGPRVRFDDDDDKNNGGGSKGGGHGNTKIPFGLCQREGIDINPDWTPKDAWNALSGKGYSAADVYKELKSTGKVAKRDVKITFTPYVPEKPKMDKKQAEQVVKDYKARGKQLKSLQKERDALDKEYTDAKHGFSFCAWKSEDLLKQIEDHEKQKPPYSGVDYDAWSEKNQELHSKLAENTKKANEYMKTRDDKKKQLDDKKDEIQAFQDQEEEENRKCREAMQSVVDQSPFKDNVKKYRELEQDLKPVMREKGSLDSRLREHEIAKKHYQELAEKTTDPEFREYCEDHVLLSQSEISAIKEKKAKVDAKVADITGQMGSMKDGIKQKDWKQVQDYMNELDTIPESKYSDLQSYALDMRIKKVSYKNIMKHVKQPSEEDIIATLGGGDNTGGSCASLVLAYAANKAGYNVLDFRGGASRSVVASNYDNMIKKLGGFRESSPDDFRSAHTILNNVEEGKEYCFAAGSHAAVIRKRNGKIEYLELQSHGSNGWFELNDNSLKRRFKCRSRRTRSFAPSSLIEIGKVSESKEAISYLGYVNTAEDKQKKGRYGGIR